MATENARLSLLIVEDERAVSNVIVTMISARFPDLVIYTANDGKPGLELFKLHSPDVIVTDIMMPGMDGISMAAEIKRLKPETIIIAVTGYTKTDDLLQAIEIGIDHYLLKPVFMDKLSTIIGQIIAAKAKNADFKRLEEELRLSEERFRMTILNSPVTVSSQDLELRYTWICNPQPGYSDGDVVGRTDAELFPAEAARWIGDLKRRVLAGGTSIRAEIEVPKPEASLWYDLTVEPLRNLEGKLVGVNNIMVDITNRKRAEESINVLNASLEQRVSDRTAELEAAIQELESFSYTVSHDLRAPLRHINSFSALLREDLGPDLPGQSRDYLERIGEATRRMGDMIDHLLELSQISRAELQRESVDLSSLAESTATMLRETEPLRCVEFCIEQGLRVQGDRKLLRQLLENLLGNAWKYSSKREKARIEFGRVEVAGIKSFFVRDNGVGFDMAYRDKLFDIFQRLHGSEFEGTGIGLATVKNIIQRHGGSVWAEGTVDEGATFYFRL